MKNNIVSEKFVLKIVDIKENIKTANTCIAGLKFSKKNEQAVILNLLRAVKKIKKTLDEIKKEGKTREEIGMLKSIKEEIKISFSHMESIMNENYFVFSYIKENFLI